MASCIFCQIIAGALPSQRVYEDDRCYAFVDIRPAAPTHLLLVPKKHIAMIAELEADDAPLIGHLFAVARQLATERGLEHYRLVINNGSGVGQSVFHIHLHLLAGRTMGWPPG
jgi:histidine triad (HIT) family protein